MVLDNFRGRSAFIIAVGIIAITLMSAVPVQSFNNTQPYSKNPKIESVLSQLISADDINEFALTHNLYIQDGKVRVVVELANETALLPDYVVEETRYKNKVQALVPIEKIEALSRETNVTFIRAPLKPYADTSTVIPVSTSTPPKSGFNSAIPIILSVISIFLIIKKRKRKW